jgi:hemerythrin-like metal-binding protein
VTGVREGGRFAVGVPTIDILHEECEAALAQLAGAIERGEDPGPALIALHEHLVRHFEHEESLMAETDFPPGACHQREHVSVLEVVAEVRRRYALGDRDPAERLPAAVLEWFELHARGMDAALAAWLNSPREARDAAQTPACG